MVNIVLYEPEIPQNTGNIIRTCMVFGMRLHLIEPLGFYMDEKHLRRAGMDYMEQVDYTVYTNWQDFLSKNHGSFFFSTRYGKKAPCEFDFVNIQDDIYLIFGRESTGIPKQILCENEDRCMRIPMKEEARSMNLSNCVAVIAYEVFRQREFENLSRCEVIKGSDWLKV